MVNGRGGFIFLLTGIFNFLLLSNAQNNAPDCTPTTRLVLVSETTNVSTTVLTLGCTDSDAGADGTLSCSIDSGNDGSWTLGTNCDIQAATQPDYDFGTRSYTLIVKVQDGGTPPLSSDVTVNIEIGSENDNDPLFLGAPFNITVAENEALNTILLGIAVADLDVVIVNGLDEPQKHKISITGGTGTDKFFVGDADGLYLRKALDYETTQTHALNIAVTDLGILPQKQATSNIYVTVQDVNDNAPACTTSYLYISIPEDQAKPSVLNTLTCTDPDTGTGGNVTYSIVSGNTGGAFNVVNNGGNCDIQLLGSGVIDFENSASSAFQLVVRASDGGTPILTTDVAVDIIVTSVNEATPTFHVSAANVSVNEDTARGTLVYQMTAQDTDKIDSSTSQKTISSIQAGADASKFSIDPSTAAVYLKEQLDFETSQSHSITLVVTDQGISPQKSSTAVLTFNVQNVNDNAPTCTKTYFAVTMTETDAIDTNIQDVSCTDVDTNNVTYSIVSGNALDKFKMQGSLVKLKATIDADTETTQYSLKIDVVDGLLAPLLTTTVVVDVYVTGVDDNQPVWETPTNGNYTTTLPENSNVGTLVQLIRATDADLSGTSHAQITYSIENINSIFGIEGTTGKVFLAKAGVDRETLNSYNIVVSAYSSDKTANKIVGNVAVTVSDVNDVTPTFTKSVYHVTVAEDTTVNSGILTVTAIDTDLNANGQVSYSIISGNAGAGCSLSIDANTGVISPTTFLDYESAVLCTLVVKATDGGTPTPKTSTSTVYVSVTGINEFTPTFTGNLTGVVQENSATGIVLPFTAATDGDNGIDGTVVYSINTNTATFAIQENKAEILLIRSLDRESKSVYEIQILAVDKAPTNKKTGTATMTVTVQDVNEFPPACTISAEVVGTPPFTINAAIYTAVCTDQDEGANGNIVYAISSGNTNADFRVEADGRVVHNKLPSNTHYQLTVEASDSGTPPLSTSIFINIILEADPKLTNLPGTPSIAESSAIGATVFDVTGSATSGFKSFSITSGNTENKFRINSFTGKIFVYAALDRETTSIYTLGIRITDINLSRTADGTVTVTVTDSNDNTPSFASTLIDTSVAENIGVGTQMLDLTATDSDAVGPNSAITYSIASGNAENKFSIDASGKLNLITALDAETTQQYLLTVTATDAGTPKRTGTTVVLIQVTNINEFPTEFLTTGNVYSHTLSESTALGSLVFTVTARDLDVGSQITYTITNGNDGSFTIDGATGNIFLTKLLDRETTASYALTITASNGQGTTTQATLNLQVLDVNDNDPKFSKNVYTTSVAENYVIGGSVTKVTCTDKDDGVNSALTLSIVAGNVGNAFRISGDVIELNSNLNYDTLNKYAILIEGKDNGATARSSTATIEIDVTPVHKQPRFATNTQPVTIPENTVVGTTIYDADATLSGAAENKDLSYSITSGNAAGKFSVNQITGELSIIGVLDRDTTANYDITIKAENTLQTTLRDLVTVSITLSDINDNDPLFPSPKYTFTIDETASINTVIGTLTASDKDSGVNSQISYSIVSGEGLSDFAIDSSTGQVKVNGVLNSPTRSSYSLKVQATDKGTPALSSTVDMEITVVDVNDNTPTFSPSNSIVKINEIVNISHPVYTVYATDADVGANAKLTYSILSGNTGLRFSVGAVDGKILLRNVLDRETINAYTLVIIAVDAGSPQRTGSLTLSVEVTDANDNNPAFIGDPYSVTIGRADTIGTYLTTITSNDVDLLDNGVVEYFIISGDVFDTFYIDKDSGRVTTVTSLTLSSDVHKLVIHAIDKGVPKRTSTTTLTVNIDPPITPPVSDYAFTISENTTVNTIIGTVIPDAIHNPGSTVSYTIVSGNYNNDMKIGINSGIVQVAKSLDYETRSNYYLTVKLQDSVNTGLTYNKDVHISISDINDNTPTFPAAMITFNDVVENSPVGHTIGQLSASDADSGSNGQILYEIDPSNTNALTLLSISSTGHLILRVSPDYESSPRIAFIVFAKDQGSPARTGSVDVVIDLVDVYDRVQSSLEAGVSPFYSLECPITANNNDVVLTMKVTDFGFTVGANDTVRYLIIGGGSVFNVGTTTGEVYVSDRSVLYDSTRYFFTATVRIQTPENNVTAATAMIRIDTMTPTSHMVVLTHSVSKATVESQQHLLKASLQNLFPANCRVGIWRITGKTASGRRRLLAETSESNVYVVNSLTADTQSGIETTKSFMTQQNILSVLQESSDGTPSAVLTTPTFATFPVTSVIAATDTVATEDTSWPETTEGIAVLTTIGITLLLLVIFLVTYCICRQKRKYSFENEDTDSSKSLTLPDRMSTPKEAFVVSNIPSDALPVIPTYNESLQHDVYNPRKQGNKEDYIRKQYGKQNVKQVTMTDLELSSPHADYAERMIQFFGSRPNAIPPTSNELSYLNCDSYTEHDINQRINSNLTFPKLDSMKSTFLYRHGPRAPQRML